MFSQTITIHILITRQYTFDVSSWWKISADLAEPERRGIKGFGKGMRKDIS